MGNAQEALELVADAEHLASGRERAIAPPAGVYLLKLFRLAHVTGPAEALVHAREMRERYRGIHPLLFLDATAAVAWLETRISGSASEETTTDITMFDRLQAHGRRMELIQDGFLT
jgi:hypothetical protein